VTGATGFLGHNLVLRLVARGHRVRALVRPGSSTSFLARHGVEIHCAADITDAAGVRQACVGCRDVIHAAAHFRMWGPLATFWRSNVEGTATVLKAAQEASVERFVHVIDEEHPCRPQDFYQRTKLEAEQLALAYHRYLGLPVIVLRPGAFYGPWGHYAFNRLFFEDPLRGWRIKVNQGRHVTFPAYAPDVAAGIEAALTQGRAGEIYNLCGQSLSHNTVNDIVSDLTGISRWRLNIPVPAVLFLAHALTALSRFTRREPFYPANLAHYVFQDWFVSSHKAQQELAFRPTPFVEGARETLAWYRREGLL
jgi:dihydroflavonol-4-reductase